MKEDNVAVHDTRTEERGDERQDALSSLAIFRGVAAVLLEARVSRECMASALGMLKNEIESGEPVLPDLSGVVWFMKITEIVHEWCHTPSCTSPTNGRPLPLRLDSGELTLRELIQKRFPAAEVKRVLLYMEEIDAIFLRDDGAYELKRPFNLVMIEPHSPAALERVASLMVRQLRTGLQNLECPDQESKNLEREAYVPRLPVKYLSAFREFTKQQGQNFLESIDAWLTSKNAPGSREPTVEASVHVCAHTVSSHFPGKQLRARKVSH